MPALSGGIGGYIDRLLGPGATAAEYAIQMLLPGAATIAAYFFAQEAFPAWPWWKLLIYCVLVFDIVGGIVTNATSSAKRWFHRDTQTWRDHLGFVALHIVQIAIVATLFRDLDWSYGVFLSAYLLSAAALILMLPLYLQRPVALFLVAMGMVLELYGWGPSTEVPWFTAFLLLKLLAAHLLREEPYRPA
ncbi:MAG: hypothetical protein HEP70_01155 [Rhodobiaceae bacterium]|nr:hypothetical protein [Rhodobiaceae bacterium]